jgi:hypothetical protein
VFYVVLFIKPNSEKLSKIFESKHTPAQTQLALKQKGMNVGEMLALYARHHDLTPRTMPTSC